LWGKVDAFDRGHPVYKTIERLAAVRQNQPALRYGRQYFRPISGDGLHFGISSFLAGVLAFSRILNSQEVVVDFALNPVGSTYIPIFSNKTLSRSNEHGGAAPGPVGEKPAGQVEIHEVNSTVTRGPARAAQVSLERMEMQILVKIGE
jgi:hypothetical protein